MNFVSGTRALAAFAALACATLLTLAGCSSAATSPSEESTGQVVTQFVTPRTMPAGMGSGQADGVFPRTVKHFRGETTIDAAPTRVVAISTGQVDLLLSLGIVPIGSAAGDGADLIPQYLYTAFPQHRAALDAVADVGSRQAPNVERIAALRPDLILVNKTAVDENTYALLSAVAPTVVTQGTGLYWKQDYLLNADALGKADAAEKWLATYQSDAAAWGKTVAPGTTVSFLRKNGDRIRIFGIASFTGSVAEDAGLARPEPQSFKKTSADISPEELTDADGDWIFYGVQGSITTEITNLQLWANLGAVKAGHAVPVDDDVFYLNVGPTAAQAVLDQLKKSIG